MRRELVPNCFLRAHVTILPPRPVSIRPEEAWNALGRLIPHFSPFEVELTRVDVFPVTDVIYINIGTGREKVTALHDALAVNGLGCQEPFSYQPHVTLAQELQPDELDELVRVARARWAESSLPRSFRVEKAVFVQNTRRNEWIDIAECSLGHSDAHLLGEMTDILAGG